MNITQVIRDVASGCLQEILYAESSYFDESRGGVVYLKYYGYPDGTVVCLSTCNGSTRVEV